MTPPAPRIACVNLPRVAVAALAHGVQAAVEDLLDRIQARFGADAVRQGRRPDPDSPLHERRGVLVPWRRELG